MRIFLITTLLLILLGKLSAQGTDTLYINYISHAPLAYKEGGEIKGIEIELIKKYTIWLQLKKNMHVILKYSEFTNYQTLYEQTRLKSRNSFGLASAIISQGKDPEVEYSLPYIKSVAFCVTNVNAVDIKQNTKDEIIQTLGGMTALTIKNTYLSKYVEEIKKEVIQDLKINYFESERKILDAVSRNVLNFAYVDGITFWNYLKDNPSKSLKMQRVMSKSKEELGFILPKGCPHNPFFKEFFNDFKSSAGYHALLEKYLGAYMTQNIALK